MPEGVTLIRLPNTFEQLDFIQGSFSVMCCALDNFECNKRLFPGSLCIITPSCLLVAVRCKAVLLEGNILRINRRLTGNYELLEIPSLQLGKAEFYEADK